MTLQFESGEERLAGGVPVIWVAGELDLATREQIEPRLSALAETESALILDLRRCTFVDSSALALLARVHQDISRRNGDAPGFALVADNKDVLRILELSGIDGVLPIVATPEEAAAALRQRRERTE
jgi:anti-sigma B factor antagonist